MAVTRVTLGGSRQETGTTSRVTINGWRQETASVATSVALTGLEATSAQGDLARLHSNPRAGLEATSAGGTLTPPTQTDEQQVYDLDAVRIDVQTIEEAAQASGEPAAAPAEISGDPLQDMIREQQDEQDKAARDLMEQLKVK